MTAADSSMRDAMERSPSSGEPTERTWAVHPKASKLEPHALGSQAGIAACASQSVLRTHAPFRSSSTWPARTRAAGVEISIAHDLASVEAEWREFEKRADHTVFQAFDWLAAWQRHIGAREDMVPAIVLGRHVDGHLLFILPLAITRPAHRAEGAILGADGRRQPVRAAGTPRILSGDCRPSRAARARPRQPTRDRL
jgi:hypothetical protein